MSASLSLVDLVQSGIDEVLTERRAQLAEIAPELSALTDATAELMQGGKRFRARFLFWGWHSVAARDLHRDPLAKWNDYPDFPRVVEAATALEFFHASALVHDDLIDNSDTRRGRPAPHRRFEAQHRHAGWKGSAERFGRSSALLLGDLLLSWSEELFASAMAGLSQLESAQTARVLFNRMRTEVMAGQFLDVVEEQLWPDNGAGSLNRAHRVIVYKSAKYSVEAPLCIGAAMAGADAEQAEALSRFGLPLGVAFQLRDDILGIFGDPAITGKPSGDDLREGKQTVLIAIARHRLPTTMSRLLDELLGDRDLRDDQIGMLQTAISESGAVRQVETLIDRELTLAREALHDAALSGEAKDQLLGLAEAATRRSS